MASALEIAGDVDAGERSAAATVDAALVAMLSLDAELHFVSTPMSTEARAIAAMVDDRPPGQRGRLAGVPIMIKDGTSLETPLVERLIAAGAVPIGTSTRPDPQATCQAWGWNGTDHTRNPWQTDRSSGGSSAGSAVAVAAGVVPLATGGDSAGSLRIPAAFCGVVGMKATPGRIPRTGRSLAQLTGAGVIAADLDDLAATVEIASGSHPRDPLALPPWRHVRPSIDYLPRVGFSADLGYAKTDPAMAQIVRRRLALLRSDRVIELVDIRLRVPDPSSAWTALYDLDRGRPVAPERLSGALDYRRDIDGELAAVFSGLDVLVTPTTPQTAFPCEDYARHIVAGDLCWIFNITGRPAVTVPIALLDGLPAAAQVVAVPHQESAAIHAANVIMNPLGTPPLHAP